MNPSRDSSHRGVIILPGPPNKQVAFTTQRDVRIPTSKSPSSIAPTCRSVQSSRPPPKGKNEIRTSREFMWRVRCTHTRKGSRLLCIFGVFGSICRGKGKWGHFVCGAGTVTRRIKGTWVRVAVPHPRIVQVLRVSSKASPSKAKHTEKRGCGTATRGCPSLLVLKVGPSRKKR